MSITPRSPDKLATSGEQLRTITSSPSRLQAPDASQCVITASSGGTQLQAPGSVNTNAVSAVIRNNSGNAPMYVGSITTPPYSGKGFLLGGGDGLTLNVADITIIRVSAATSGQRLSYIWSQL
jgi:hypothetical protein